MKKQRLSPKIIGIFLVFLLTVGLLISCGATSDAKADIGESNKLSGGSGYPSGDYAEGGSATDTSGGIGNLPTGGVDNPSAKVIKTANARMRTDKYDEFITGLYAKITEFGGYTDGETFSGSTPSRYANITVRVPAEKLEDFKTALQGIGIIDYYNASKQDVSLTYATLKAEVDTLTQEIAVIEELFQIAKTDGDLQDISNLEAKLTDLRLRIAKANAQLSVYDNSIAYSTLYLTVNEFEPKGEPEPEPEEKGAFQRIGENLLKAMRGIGNFFVELFVFLISALPYILVIGLFASIPLAIIIIRKKKSKSESGKSTETDSKEEP